MITFECCHSHNDHVKLVPYYGNHHQTHDQRFRHVPLLENVTLPPDDFQESHAFQNFRTKFLDQIKVWCLHMIFLYGVSNRDTTFVTRIDQLKIIGFSPQTPV